MVDADWFLCGNEYDFFCIKTPKMYTWTSKYFIFSTYTEPKRCFLNEYGKQDHSTKLPLKGITQYNKQTQAISLHSFIPQIQFEQPHLTRRHHCPVPLLLPRNHPFREI